MLKAGVPGGGGGGLLLEVREAAAGCAGSAVVGGVVAPGVGEGIVVGGGARAVGPKQRATEPRDEGGLAFGRALAVVAVAQSWARVGRGTRFGCGAGLDGAHAGTAAAGWALRIVTKKSGPVRAWGQDIPGVDGVQVVG